jgi:hypothetical protein
LERLQSKDSNDDGKGDTPYIIDENNRDNYPLMNPVVIPEFPERADELEPFPTALVTVSAVAVAVVGLGLLVYFKKRHPKWELKHEKEYLHYLLF